MIRMMLFILLAASIGWGDTINSTAKNPSMLAYGTPRSSTAISTLIEQGCPGWSGDLNTLEGTPGASTCINGAGLGNAPTGDWYFVHTDRHYNPGNYYAVQRAVGMTGGVAGKEYIRSQQSGSANVGWSAWAQAGGSDTAYIAVNGYTKLPSGLIIQWGRSATMNTYVSFPMVFPNAFLSATASVSGSTELSFSPGIYNTSQWGMSLIQNVYNGNQPTTPASWMAIGY